MILRQGVHTLRRDCNIDRPMTLDWASVSASSPSRVTVRLEEGEVIEDVFVGPYSPHTWWSSNSLLHKIELEPEQAIVIVIGRDAIMRIETNLVKE